MFLYIPCDIKCINRVRYQSQVLCTIVDCGRMISLCFYSLPAEESFQCLELCIFPSVDAGDILDTLYVQSNG